MGKRNLDLQHWLASFAAAVFGRSPASRRREEQRQGKDGTEHGPPAPPAPDEAATRSDGFRGAGGGGDGGNGGPLEAGLPPGGAGSDDLRRLPLEDPDNAAFYLLLCLFGLCLLWFMHMLFDRRATLWEFCKRIDLIVFTLPVAWFFFFRVPFAMLFESKEGLLEIRTLIRRHLMPEGDERRQRATLRGLRQTLLFLVLGGWFLSGLPTRFEMEFERAMALAYSGQTGEAAALVDSLWTTRRNVSSYFLKEEALNQYERRLSALAHLTIRAEETDRAFRTGEADWRPLEQDLASWRAEFGREYFHGQVLASFVKSALHDPHAALLEVRQAVRMADTPLRRAEAALFSARAYLGESDLGLAEIQIARVLERSILEDDRPFAWSTLMHFIRKAICRDPSYSLEDLPFEWRARNVYSIIQALGLNYASAESGWESILRDGMPGVQRARVLANLGELAVVKERWAEAESRLKEALREDQHWLPAQLNLIEMYALRGNYIQARNGTLVVKAQYAAATTSGPADSPSAGDGGCARLDSRAELVALHSIWLRLRQDAFEAPSQGAPLRYRLDHPGRLQGVLKEAGELCALKPFVESVQPLPAAAPKKGKAGWQPAQAGRDDFARLLLGLARRYQEVSIGYGGDIVPREFAIAAQHEAQSQEMLSDVRAMLDRFPPALVDNPALVLAESDAPAAAGG